MAPIALFTSPTDWAIIVVVVVLLFGSSRIAGLGKAAGESIRDFKKALRDDDEPAKQAPAEKPQEAKREE